MKMCEQLEIDLQSPLMERVRHGFSRGSMDHSQSCNCSLNNLENVSSTGDTNDMTPECRGGNSKESNEIRDVIELQRKASLATDVLELKATFREMASVVASDTSGTSDRQAGLSVKKLPHQFTVISGNNNGPSCPSPFNTSNETFSRYQHQGRKCSVTFQVSMALGFLVIIIFSCSFYFM